MRFCDIISNHCFPHQQQVVQVVQCVHIETDWSRRDPQVVQCVHFVQFVQFVQFCTVLNSLYILKLIGPKGTNRLYSEYSLDILKLIGPEGTDRLYSFVQFETNGTKGTKSIVSDLVNILKMIGLEGTLRFVQCVLCCVQIYKQGRLENL